MNMRRGCYQLFLALLLAVAGICAQGQVAEDRSILWTLDNLTEIGGKRPTILGDPQVITSPEGKAILFDGQDDGVILDTNPLAGLRSFTLEVIFRPDAGGASEQRFVHMQAGEDRRVLVETRLVDDSHWFLDTFIKSGSSERTLQSKEALHPLGRWYHAALVYDGREMRHYVDGVREISGYVEYHPVEGGRTSIGCRLNQVFWFKGAVSRVRITGRALAPAQFLNRP